MKLALPSRGDLIDGHFGHCEYFTVFTTDDSKIVSKEILPSPAECGCKSNIATTLADMGVSLLLAGNMGEGAVNVLSRSGIQVVRGCSGDVKEVALSWLAGAVMDSGEMCHAHDDGHVCQH